MSPKAKKLARRLLRANRGTRRNAGRSWRTISREDYGNTIPAGTLCRIALEGGEWLPKDIDMLISLGLKRERKAKEIFTPIYDMATSALHQALIHRSEMPPVDPRILREFKKLGWIKRTRTA
jgi:hypothetical protein